MSRETKGNERLKEREINDCRISFVIILRETEGEPNNRFAPSRERDTERETVGVQCMLLLRQIRNKMD